MDDRERGGQYTRGEIKFNIDTAIQKSMWTFRNHDNKDAIYNSLLDAQTSLYEEFDIIE